MNERGFTYLGLLFGVAAMGTVLAATAEVWHTAQQREKERELLFVGDQFRQAIAQYYVNSPGTANRYPRRLEELLKDPRQLVPQRYLRKIFVDPITGNRKWGLVNNAEGAIIGVYSLSENAPLKTGNFSLSDKDFPSASRYSDWKFVYATPGATSQFPAAPALIQTRSPTNVTPDLL